MISPELAETGTVLEIDILGRCFDAVVIEESPFDPANQKIAGIKEITLLPG